MRLPLPSETGFTLVESIIATALLAIAVVALAHLLAIGARQSADHRRALLAAFDAQNKIEELRAVPWRLGVDGLQPSPAGSLTEDVAGFSDTAHGMVRRWAIASLAPALPDVMALYACVYADTSRTLPVICVRTVRARRP